MLAGRRYTGFTAKTPIYITMKKLVFLLLLSPLFTLAQNASQSFVINGKISGLPNGEVTINVAMQNDQHTIASGTATNGVFTMKGSIPEPGLYTLVLPGQKPLNIFLENHTITITGTQQDIQNLKVEGSSSNNDLVQFNKEFDPFFQSLNALAVNIKKENNEKKRNELISQYNVVSKNLDAQLGTFVAAHRSSYTSLLVLGELRQLTPDISVLETRYNSLSEDVRNSQMGKSLAGVIEFEKVGSVGTTAMDFTQSDINGNPVSLSSFKGKYVLLDFWASWCRPCRAENPNVVRAYGKFKDKNFTILSVSLDQQKEAWLKAIQADHLSWNSHVSDLQQWNNAVAQLYHIQSIPGNFLIDPNGKIIAKDLRGEELESKLCELLGCN